MSYSCPHCGQQISIDPSDVSKAICYSCRKRYNVSDLERLEASRNIQASQPTMQQSPVQQEQRTMPYSPNPEQAQQQQYVPQAEQYVYQQAPQQASPYQQQPYQYDPYQQQSVCPPQYAPQSSGTSGLSVVSLIMGIFGICSAWIPILNFFSLIFGGVGLACGLVARSKIKNGLIPPKTNNGLAIAGIVTSIISIVFMILMTFGYCAIISVGSSVS